MSNLSKVQAEVEAIDPMGGNVTDVTVANQVASYTVDPGSDTGYVQEVLLPTMERRNCGLGRGCFWTDWQ